MQLPAFIDIEASGFGRGSYPIEVGFVDRDGQLFCTLVQPRPTGHTGRRRGRPARHRRELPAAMPAPGWPSS
ncbi:MAG: hypothetical protein U1E77_01625 [Inhella sp.]